MVKAQDFTLEKLNESKPWSLHQVKDKIVMLTFWTSWCPDSLYDLQLKQKLYQATKESKPIEMMMIHVTGRDPKADVAAFIKRKGYTFPVLIDRGTTVYDQYLCNGVPTTILINENHEIVYTYGDRATMINIMQGITNILT